MELAERLKAQREKLGLSQGDVADKLHITRQTVSRWETGKGTPDLENLVLLSEVYQVTVDELLKEQNTDKEEKKKMSEEKSRYFWGCLISLLVGLLLLMIDLLYFDSHWGGGPGFADYMKYWILDQPMFHLIAVIPFIIAAILWRKYKK